MPTDEQEQHRRTLSRRRLLAVSMAAAGTTVAGCMGGGGGGETEEPTEAATATATATATPKPTEKEASLSEPAAPTEEDECAVCKMMPAKFPDYNAQLTVEAGDRVHFCSSGCMVAYYVDPGHFNSNHEGASYVGVWAHDHATKDLIDATAAWFVKEMDAERVDDPMMKNPLPFAEEADATAYVGQYDDLSEADILKLADFDLELAKKYRGKFFE